MDHVKALTENCTCNNCGNSFRGSYCNVCGEKVVTLHDKSIRHFIGHYVHGLTHFDTKFFRNFKAVFTHPGLISKDSIEGRKTRWFNLFSFFLTLNLIYFLLPFVDTFNTHLEAQMTLMPYSTAIVKPLVTNKLAEEKVSFEEFSEEYNHKSAKTAKMLIILLVLGLAVLFSILQYKKHFYFTDHLTLALEGMSFILILIGLILPLIIKILGYTNQLFNFNLTSVNLEPVLSALLGLMLVIFLGRAFRLFYLDSRWISIVKAMVTLTGLFIALMIYRLLLFLIVFWQI